MKKTTLSALMMGLFMMVSANIFAQALPITGTFDSTLDGWTYITNNSQYPDPSYYTSTTGPKGLKFNFEGQGVESPTFTAVNAVKVTINIGALNANTKTASSDDAFTVTGYDADDNAVAGATLAGTGVSVEIGRAHV